MDAKVFLDAAENMAAEDFEYGCCTALWNTLGCEHEHRRFFQLMFPWRSEPVEYYAHWGHNYAGNRECRVLALLICYWALKLETESGRNQRVSGEETLDGN